MRFGHLRLVLLPVALSACGDKPGTGSADAAPGGTVVIAVTSAVLRPPPHAMDAQSRAVADQVYDRLAQIGPAYNTMGDAGFEPRLARSWSWAPDSLSIAFAIHPEARWHDGRPVRAADVKFSFDVLKDPATATPLIAATVNVDSVTVRDSLTAVAWFKRRTPDQFYDLVYQMHVMPEHVMRGIPRAQLQTTDMSDKLVGSGRFRLQRYQPNVRVELIADTANYRGRAKLDRVIWTVATDPSAALAQLLGGQADVLDNLPAAVVADLDSTSRVRAERYRGFQFAMMGMNQRDPVRAGAPHPVFGDPLVRQAISVALDRSAMLRNVFDTLGTSLNGPLPRALADTTIRPPAFDRARAAALLDSAGWRPGPDGVRTKNGRPLAFSLTVPTSSAPRMRYAVLVQEQLRNIGARVTIDAVEIGALMDKQNRKAFDAMLMAFSVDPSVMGLKQYWASASMQRGGNNYLGYSNPVVDAALDSLSLTTNADRRATLARRAVQTIVDDAPAVWLYEVLAMIAVHNRIRTTGLRADGWWAGLADWWIPEGERIDRDRIGLRPAQP